MRLANLTVALLVCLLVWPRVVLPSALAADAVRGVTASEIIIGTYTDLSGVNKSNAWRPVFDDVNAGGGINGRKRPRASIR